MSFDTGRIAANSIIICLYYTHYKSFLIYYRVIVVIIHETWLQALVLLQMDEFSFKIRVCKATCGDSHASLIHACAEESKKNVLFNLQVNGPGRF